MRGLHVPNKIFILKPNKDVHSLNFLRYYTGAFFNFQGWQMFYCGDIQDKNSKYIF
jgi:hypothetical protein